MRLTSTSRQPGCKVSSRSSRSRSSSRGSVGCAGSRYLMVCIRAPPCLRCNLREEGLNRLEARTVQVEYHRVARRGEAAQSNIQAGNLYWDNGIDHLAQGRIGTIVYQLGSLLWIGCYDDSRGRDYTAIS